MGKRWAEKLGIQHADDRSLADVGFYAGINIEIIRLHSFQDPTALA
jgi:hypothetical protein